MSLQTFLATVEADIIAEVKVIEDDVDTALTDIWNFAKPVFTAFEPVVIRDTLTAVVNFLKAAEADVVGGNFADIEQAFLMALESAGSALFGDAQSLGSNLLQVLIGLAKGSL